MLKRKPKEQSRKELSKSITARIFRGERFWVAECAEITVATQGRTLDETVANLKDAVGLFLDGENPRDFGLVRKPKISVTIEAGPVFPIPNP